MTRLSLQEAEIFFEDSLEYLTDLKLGLADVDDIGRRIVTTAPDVSISTNLGGWINKAGVFWHTDRDDHGGADRLLKWAPSPSGQHIELGISEMNLFMLLGQLGLALEAGVSARHVSFLETGRARPSPAMVDRLGAALHLPLAARNGLRAAAGFAPRHVRRAWDAAEMAPIRAAVDQEAGKRDPAAGQAQHRHAATGEGVEVEGREVHAGDRRVGGQGQLSSPTVAP